MPTIATDQKRPRARRVAVAAALVVALASLAPAASAQPAGASSTQEAEADALFQRANELVAKKDFAAACPLFEQAYHLAGGGGTAQNLAICYEDLGKVAQAYRAFGELRRVSASPPRPDRIKLAEERMARLEPRLSRLRVRVPEARRSAETLVTVDGDTYGDKALEEGIVVDVGPHVVKVVSPGKKPLEVSRTIAHEGSVEIVEIPAGDPAPVPEAAPPGKKDDAQASRDATRTAGLVLGGAGLATLVVGGVFGILTATTNASARSACRDQTPDQSLSNKGSTDDPTKFFDAAGNCYASTPERPNPYLEDANRTRDLARSYGTLSTLMVPIGLAGVVAGTYLLLVSRPPSAPSKMARAPQRPTLVPGLGGVLLVGELP